MKQELLRKITPIIEHFVDDTLKTFDDLGKTRKSLVQQERHYQDLVEEKQKELTDIKTRKTLEKAENDDRITELNNAKDNFLLKAKGYDDLIKELAAKKKELESNLSKSKIELIRAKDNRDQTEIVRDEAEDIKLDYDIKLESLKGDFSKLAEKEAQADIKDKKLTVRENNVFLDESRNEQKTQELNDLDLKVKADRKEVDRLIKRYKLKES